MTFDVSSDHTTFYRGGGGGRHTEIKKERKKVFWHTCDLEARSRSSNLVNLVWIERLQAWWSSSKFERPRSNSVREKASLKVFCQPKKHFSYLTWKHTKVKNKKKQKRQVNDLLNVLDSHIKSQLNRIRTSNFVPKLFDAAVTSKYGQDHWR